jgi:putative beta-lysine N-acetyltransferase
VDRIETIKGSLLQHGHHNNRIYLMRLNTGRDIQLLIESLDRLARDKGYAKILAKIPATTWDAFKQAGFTKEAFVPGFFRGETDACFAAKFFTPLKQQAQPAKEHFIADRAGRADPLSAEQQETGASWYMEACEPSDVPEMCGIYRRIFKTYPFPIHEQDHLRHMMRAGARYFCIRAEEKIAALAAAEIDRQSQTAEMTDFGTLPGQRGQGFAGRLLRRLDRAAGGAGVRTAYTIARADAAGINKIFANSGYRYAGLLRRNSQISGRIRDMTVWYKHL